jgi:predicted transcriptional regulator
MDKNSLKSNRDPITGIIRDILKVETEMESPFTEMFFMKKINPSKKKSPEIIDRIMSDRFSE